jgi:hypothetical protein
MGPIEWIVTGLSIILSVGGGLCAVLLPILILGGIGYFLYRRNQQSTAYRQTAQAWPSTTGKVLVSSVQSGRRGRSGTKYPVVGYQYEVNGKSYTNQTIKAGEQFFNARAIGQAQATVARYPIGANVTVYYNPANPAESALER